jgi:hypothetical protein
MSSKSVHREIYVFMIILKLIQQKSIKFVKQQQQRSTLAYQITMTWNKRKLIELVPAQKHHTPKHSLCVTVHETTTFTLLQISLPYWCFPTHPTSLSNYHEISACLARRHHLTSCSILSRSDYLQQPRFTPFTRFRGTEKKTRSSYCTWRPFTEQLSYYLSEYRQIFTQQILVPTYRPKEVRIQS